MPLSIEESRAGSSPLAESGHAVGWILRRAEPVSDAASV